MLNQKFFFLGVLGVLYILQTNFFLYLFSMNKILFVKILCILFATPVWTHWGWQVTSSDKPIVTQKQQETKETAFTFVLLSWRLPLYHVMMAAGRDPADSQVTSYLLSATRGLTVFRILAVSGFTATEQGCWVVRISLG